MLTGLCLEAMRPIHGSPSNKGIQSSQKPLSVRMTTRI